MKTVSSPPTGAHMVLSLPVSTTSYSRHAVSTVQTSISCANNERALTDTSGGLLFIHFIFITIFLSARSQFSYISSSLPTFSSQRYSFCISRVTKNHSTSSYISRVTGNHSTSTESYLSMAVLTTYIYTSIRPKEPGDNATKVPNNS